MSTGLTWQTTSTNLDDTLELAAAIGRRLRGGEVIELISDLGGGKTTFVRGLVNGLGSQDAVRSPSFTIGNQYRGKDLTIYHFDFYRLQESGILREEVAEILTDPKAVLAVEWAEIVEDVLPTRRLTVTLKATGDNSRELSVDYPKDFNYLIDNT